MIYICGNAAADDDDGDEGDGLVYSTLLYYSLETQVNDNDDNDDDGDGDDDYDDGHGAWSKVKLYRNRQKKPS